MAEIARNHQGQLDAVDMGAVFDAMIAHAIDETPDPITALAINAFKKYDANGDGGLDVEEIKSVLEELGYPQGEGGRCARLAICCCKDRSNSISTDTQDSTGATTEDIALTAKEALASCDADGDGQLDQQEFVEWFSRVGCVEVLPPGWFMAYHEDKDQSCQPDLPPETKRARLRWGEGWLVHSAFLTNLDQAFVWRPICALLLSMAVLHPLLMQKFVSADEVWDTDKPSVQLHAVGLCFWWIGPVILLDNLRKAVRPRSSWLGQVARSLGAHDAAIGEARSRGRDAVIQLIADRCANVWLEEVGRCTMAPSSEDDLEPESTEQNHVLQLEKTAMTK
eukprot:COSAG06_NODE_9547_length_1874_cov_1.238310_1_plen_336_part_10